MREESSVEEKDYESHKAAIYKVFPLYSKYSLSYKSRIMDWSEQYWWREENREKIEKEVERQGLEEDPFGFANVADKMMHDIMYPEKDFYIVYLPEQCVHYTRFPENILEAMVNDPDVTSVAYAAFDLGEVKEWMEKGKPRDWYENGRSRTLSYSFSWEILEEFDCDLNPDEPQRKMDFYLSEEVKNGTEQNVLNNIPNMPSAEERQAIKEMKYVIEQLCQEDYINLVETYRLVMERHLGIWARDLKCFPSPVDFMIAKFAEDFPGFDAQSFYLLSSACKDFVIQSAQKLYEECLKEQEERIAEQQKNRVTSYGERCLRAALEAKLKTSFPNVRHPDIINPDTGYRLELDCYSEALQIAFEYQGVQHYEVCEFFGGERALQKTRGKDEYKKKRCKELGIKLFEIDDRKLNSDKDKKKAQIEALVEELIETHALLNLVT
jgi:hypothetical protein